MSISNENIERIDCLKKTLQEQVLWLGRKNVGDASELIEKIRGVRQFTIGLSVAITGISFPQLLTQNLDSSVSDFFLVSLFLFTLNIILGLLTLFTSTHREHEEIPIVNKHHAEKIIEIINELEEIKKMNNNDEAGLQYEQLRLKSTSYPMKPLNLIQRILLTYQDLILFSLFLCGFIFLIIGLMFNLYLK